MIFGGRWSSSSSTSSLSAADRSSPALIAGRPGGVNRRSNWPNSSSPAAPRSASASVTKPAAANEDARGDGPSAEGPNATAPRYRTDPGFATAQSPASPSVAPRAEFCSKPGMTIANTPEDVNRLFGERVNAGDVEFFKQAPKLTPMRRLDDTRAARQPKLRWRRGQNDACAKVAAE